MRSLHAPYRPAIGCVLALSAFLFGCAGSVTVRHMVAPRNLPASEVGKLARIVMVMRLEPPGKPAGILGRAALDFLKEASGPDAQISVPIPRDRAYRLLAACTRAFDSPFSRVECRLVDGPFATGFIDSQRPTAVLLLEPSRIAASQRALEIKEKGGSRRKFWQFQADFSLGYRLLSWPDGRELASGRFSEHADGTGEEEIRLESWARKMDFGQSSLDELRLDLLPATAHRYRRLRKGKSEDMRSARKLARKDDWEGAAAIWKNQAGPEEEVARWNLGLYYERQGRWEEANESYSRAREAAGKRRDRSTLSGYLDELGETLAPRPAAAQESAGWFDRPVAVLPLDNRSNDLNAPELLRRLAWNELREKGYKMLPLDKVSAALREKGVTQGGQLKAVPIPEIARELGGARLLTGTIEAFKTVNVGLYNLNTVSVNFVLYDSDGGILMESQGHGYRELLVNPKESGRSFLLGLAETAVSKAARVYLEEESKEAALTGLEVLPAGPLGL